MKSLIETDNWIPLKEVAYQLRLSRHTVVRLSEDLDPMTRQPYLQAWRPSPGTVLISRQSLQQYCDATRRDPEFWADRKQAQTQLRDNSTPGPLVTNTPARKRRPRRLSLRRTRA